MKRWTVSALILLFPCFLFASSGDLESFFFNLKQLKFHEAKRIAAQEEDSTLRREMIQLADLMFYAGQKEKTFFDTEGTVVNENADNPERAIVQLLKAGYLSLYYDQLKGRAFRNFYQAYRLAEQTGNNVLIKACIFSFLKYYSFEIAQNSDYYLPYLEQLEQLRTDEIDDLWIAVYRMIFYSKSLSGLDTAYFNMSATLDQYQEIVEPDSPLLAYIYYEKALKHYLQNDLDNSKKSYQKTVDQSLDYPFLKTERFLSLIKLMTIAAEEKDFVSAESYWQKARQEVNLADTLRSNYYLNLHGSLVLNAADKTDSAYQLLKEAYRQDFQLDFRRNTLEINRLEVELETREKENANLRLRQARSWLVSMVIGLGLLFVVGYFAYINQRVRSRVQLREKEVQAMKLEKMLKDQEVFGIDAMLEGQEKERQHIANDLHDHLGSLLATIKLHFHSLRKETTPSNEHQMLQKTDDLIEEAYQKVRTIAHTRNAGVNSQEGLVPAVKSFASKVSIINQLVVDVEEHGLQGRLDNTLEITIFRIIQELITNIIKHAQATEATIHLTQHEDSLNIMVEDNGSGFDPAKIKPSLGMGIYSIQKRIENIGGTVAIDSIINKGTTVIIDIPLV